MAEFKFSGYSYIGKAEDNIDDYSRYAFDNDKLQEYFSNYEYSEAAKYLKNFKFDSPKLQNKMNDYIYEIERQGRIINAAYSGATEAQMERIKFADSVFNSGALNKITYGNNVNKYALKFNTFKNYIGGNEAEYIQVSFPEAKRTFLGMDFIATDNKRTTYEAFLKDNNYSEGYFDNNDIEVKNINGRKSLVFKKNNPLANELLNKLDLGSADYTLSVFGDDIEIYGLDSSRKQIKEDTQTAERNRAWVRSMQHMIQAAEDEKAMFFRQLNSGEKKTYSSTIGPALIENFEDLQKSVDGGYMSQSQYNYIMKQREAYIRNMINVFSGGNYTLYSNYYNTGSDETLTEIDPKDVKPYTDTISYTDPKDMEINSMICNGQIGVLISIKAQEKDGKAADNLDSESKLEEYIKRKRFQIFIPGLLYDDAQEAINSDTSTRAIKEINSMKDFGYTYELDDGKKLRYIRNNEFLYGESIAKGYPIDSKTAAKYIDRDFTIRDSIQALRRQYLTAGDKITNEEDLRNTIKIAAIRIANSLYDDSDPIPYDVKDIAGSVKKIFDYRGAGNILKPEYAAKLSEIDMYKYNDMFSIYGDILDYFRKNYGVQDI